MNIVIYHGRFWVRGAEGGYLVTEIPHQARTGSDRTH